MSLWLPHPCHSFIWVQWPSVENNWFLSFFSWYWVLSKSLGFKNDIKPLYRRRWFALRKCHVQFNLQCIVIDVGCLWQLFHDFLLCACALALHAERKLMPDKGEAAVLFPWQPPNIWMVLSISEFERNTAQKCNEKSSRAGLLAADSRLMDLVGMAKHWNIVFQKGAQHRSSWVKLWSLHE